MKTKREFRCTRNAMDMAKAKHGEDTFTRDAVFIRGDSYSDVRQEMLRRYPNEVEAGFTIQLWSLRDDKSGWFFASGLSYGNLDNYRTGFVIDRCAVQSIEGRGLPWREPLRANAS